MSVFDENREKCLYCNRYINHWDWKDNELHESGACVKESAQLVSIEELVKTRTVYDISKELGSSYDYLLDLDQTLADI